MGPGLGIRLTGIYCGFVDQFCELVILLVTKNTAELSFEQDWPPYFTEHLKLASLIHKEKVASGAMKRDQRFSFLLGFSIDDNCGVKTSSCANVKISDLSD